jgi:hypothetical protein
MNISSAKGKKGLITTIVSVLANSNQIFNCSIKGIVAAHIYISKTREENLATLSLYMTYALRTF